MGGGKQGGDDGAVDPARSELMRRVRGKDTTPERAVRRVAHALGYRFRLHRRDLPGTPDLVFSAPAEGDLRCTGVSGIGMRVARERRLRRHVPRIGARSSSRTCAETDETSRRSAAWGGACWWCGSARLSSERNFSRGCRDSWTMEAENSGGGHDAASEGRGGRGASARKLTREQSTLHAVRYSCSRSQRSNGA